LNSISDKTGNTAIFMNSKIIKTTRIRQTGAFISFVLSFLFTGLGQAYNGDLTRGFIFFAMRSLSHALLPVCMDAKTSLPHLSIFIYTACAGIIIWIWSSIDALYISKKKSNLTLKKYNSILFYLPASLLISAVMLLVYTSVFSFFSVIKVSDSNTILFKRGDYALVEKYTFKKFRKADLVIFSHEGRDQIMRIIAAEGDLLSLRKGQFFINGKRLKLGIPNSSEPDIIMETNNNVSYPVTSFLKTSQKRINSVLVKKSMYLVCPDRRHINSMMQIPEDSVKGRIEGIIFSENIERIFTFPFEKK